MIVKLLLGQICAGKTTYSLDLVKTNNYLRLSMDDLKIMMFGRISSDKFSDDIVSATIEYVITLIDSNHNKNIVIDGFPLNLEAIQYILSCYAVEIKIFTIDLFKANLRNRKREKSTGIYIQPEEINEYNTACKKFIDSEEFKKITKNTVISYVENYEKKCLVM